jgi:hypothetical protein
MTIETRQKIYNALRSVPIAAALYGIPFASFTELTADKPFSFSLFVTKVVMFGVPMALLLKWQLKKAGKPTNEGLQLRDHLKTATLPTDPKLRKAMPAFLDNVELQVKKSRGAVPVLAIIGTLNLLLAVSGRSVVLGLLSVFIFAMAAFGVYNARKTTERIAHLREQLQSK